MLGAASLHAQGEAYADEPEAEAIRVVYDVAPDCPPEASFVGEVRARTQRARVVEADERRVFTVNAGPRGRAFRGTLTIKTAADNRTSKRDVDGKSCGEVVSALALIAALAVDPRASTKAASELPPVPPAPPEPPPPAPAAPPPPPPPVAVLPAAPPPPPPPPVQPWQFAIGATGEARTGIQPKVAPVLGGFLWLAWNGDRPPTMAAVAPVVVLTLVGAIGQTATASSAALAQPGLDPTARPAADLGFFTTRLELCPFRLRLTPSRALTARPCLLGEAGLLSATGTGLSDARTEARFWSSFGASLRTSWELSDVLFVQGIFSVAVPLGRDRFYAAPDATLFHVPPVGFGVGLSLGFVLFS